MGKSGSAAARTVLHRPTALFYGLTGLFSSCARRRADVCGYYILKHGFLQLDFLQRKHLNRHCGRQRQADQRSETRRASLSSDLLFVQKKRRLCRIDYVLFLILL